MGPGFRGTCAYFGRDLDQHPASFETTASRPPQDDVLSMPSKNYVILRSARRARLEGRTTALQPAYPRLLATCQRSRLSPGMRSGNSTERLCDAPTSLMAGAVQDRGGEP